MLIHIAVAAAYHPLFRAYIHYESTLFNACKSYQSICLGCPSVSWNSVVLDGLSGCWSD